MSDALVYMKDVQKHLGGQFVIQQLNLTVAKGQIVALCGGNGAGKSTILRMLAGIMQPTQGDIIVDGLRWQDNRIVYNQNIAYVPDDYHFSSGLTALETMVFWAKLKGRSKTDAVQVLHDVGLEDNDGKPVSSFSKGMRQRMLIGQAFLANAQLILMDEPTNGLDPYWMDHFVGLLRKAASKGQTIIFSTHQLQIAEALADRIIFLHGGLIKLDGTKEDLNHQLGTAGLNAAFAELIGLNHHRV